jgi:hypothetical protein
MNKHNAKDYLPLVQALAAGRTIEYCHYDGGWRVLDCIDFTIHANRYRIKPVKGWYRVALMKDAPNVVWTHTVDSDADEFEAQGLVRFDRWLTDRIEYEV